METPSSVLSIPEGQGSVQEWLVRRSAGGEKHVNPSRQGVDRKRRASNSAFPNQNHRLQNFEATVYEDYNQPWLQPDKFMFVDQRESPSQIVISNPYPFSVRCTAICRPCDSFRSPLSNEFQYVTETVIGNKRTVAFTPNHSSMYRFNFWLLPREPGAGDGSPLVSVNLPPGVDYDIYYSVKAMEVKRKGTSAGKYAGRKKFWMNTTIDEEEIRLLDRLFSRRKKSAPRPRRNYAVARAEPSDTVIAQPQIPTEHIATSLALHKAISNKLVIRSEQVTRVREQLASYREVVQRHRAETLALMQDYRQRYFVVSEAVRQYSLDCKEKSKRQNSKLLHHMKRRIQNSLDRARDQKKEMINKLEFEVSTREKNIFTFQKKFNGMFLKFFVEGVGLVMEIPYSIAKQFGCLCRRERT
jgi:hypothetical protein